MKFGLDVANLGALADPRRVVEIALIAEEAGWEGLFIWDHWGFVWGMPAADPWVTLAAVAQATSTLRLGTAVTPLARRRPHMVAHTLATLDLLSSGRIIFGAGLGGMVEELSDFGEPDLPKTRAAMLDEGLEIVARLLEGERVNHQGTYYTVKDVKLEPNGAQSPRMPIWIGAEQGNALRRASRWDGWVIYTVDTQGETVRSIDDVARTLQLIADLRRLDGRDMQGYDVVVTGSTRPGANVDSFRESGVTWWLETLHGQRVGFDELLARVKAGPPQPG